MINRLTDTPDYFVKHSHAEKINHAIDAAHREMTAYQNEPLLSPARREHFLRMLKQLEDADRLAREYPVAHSNRIRQTGGWV